MKGDEKLRARLERIAGNLWWTWSPKAGALWDLVASAVPHSRRASLRRNPVLLLRSLSDSRLRELAASCDLVDLLRDTERRFARALRRRPPPPGLSPAAPIAYFSMEFGVHESLPIYAGGLGVLAGDHLKSASDAAVPVVGVTLLYGCGYFRQRIDARGRQVVVYPRADFSTLPIALARGPGGGELRVEVELPGGPVALRVWKAAVGRRELYLLDSDVPGASPRHRAITERLYVGDREARIAQEVVLGIGGVRALRALGIRPGAWHLNEGHVVFQGLERVRELRASAGLGLDEALEVVAADTVFTTHTPVPEGNEVFDLALAERYLALHCAAAGVSTAEVLELGLDRGGDGRPVLSLTVLALRLSRFRNGVSALHGEVTRRMWAKLWPGFRAAEAPITSVTNGVHVASWVAPQYDAIYCVRLGADWAEHVADGVMWRAARRIPDRVLWDAKRELRRELVEYVRRRTRARLEREGSSAARARAAVEGLLDPEALTIGFARRFALYKRAGLLFRDLERVAKLLNSRSRPVQIVFAGKPHPEDPLGKRLCEEIARLTRHPKLRGRVVLLEDYDVELARHLVRGTDVWLNTPRRPQEASGTSGQKVAVNCGLSLSVLDGWWCEGYSPDVGWAIGAGREYVDAAQQDREDHADLLRVLEREVVPLYYERDARGVPRRWMRKVKAALERLVPRFSSQHMVLEYASRLYAPACENGRFLRAGGYRLGRALAAWRREVLRAWPLVHVREVRRAPARSREVEVEVYLESLGPESIAFCDERGDLLEVFAASVAPSGAWRFRIEGPSREAGGAGGRVRLFPTHPALVHPQELGLSCEFAVSEGSR